MAVRRLYRYTHNALRSTVDCLRPEPVRPVSSSAVWDPPSDNKLSPSLSEDSRFYRAWLVQDAVELRAPIALAVVADGT